MSGQSYPPCWSHGHKDRQLANHGEGGGGAKDCRYGISGGQYHRALPPAGKQVLEIAHPVRVTVLSLICSRIRSCVCVCVCVCVCAKGIHSIMLKL